jgi:hypothetical protein
VTWQATDGRAILALDRHGPHLRVSIGSGATAVTSTFTHPPVAGTPVSVALVWQGDALRLALNGAWVGEPIALPPKLAKEWPDGRLVLGPAAASEDATPTASTARHKASIERLTVHGRSLAPEELATRAEADLAAANGRSVPPRLRVRARVVEATDPDPSALDTYHRMLVDHTYEVRAVLEGTLDAKRISVLHWAVLDDRAVPGYPRSLGSEFELDLEPHAAHPELQGELTDLTSEEFGLPLFLDVSTPASP